jgi:hypothetical protein
MPIDTVRRRATILVMSVLLTVPACGRDGNAPDVATLTSVPPTAVPPAATGDRPLIRADSTEEEVARMWDAYHRCVKENGGLDPNRPKPAGGVTPEMLAAEEKCTHVRPEHVWERAKRTDPEYRDRLREWVMCVHAYGIEATDADERLTLTLMPTDAQLRQIDECQYRAFGRG